MALRIEGAEPAGPGACTVIVAGDSLAEVEDSHACVKAAGAYIGASFADPRISRNEVRYVKPDGTAALGPLTWDEFASVSPRRYITYVNGTPLRPPGGV